MLSRVALMGVRLLPLIWVAFRVYRAIAGKERSLLQGESYVYEISD